MSKAGNRNPGGAHSSGADAVADITARGQGWPCLRQFSVYMENRVGQLHDLLRLFEGRDVKIVALSIANSVECALVRLMLNNSDRGREILSLSKFSWTEIDLVGVELPRGGQPFQSICLALLQAELNVHYMYPLLYRREGRGAIAMHVDDVDAATKTLQEKGLRVVTENDLSQFEDSDE